MWHHYKEKPLTLCFYVEKQYSWVQLIADYTWDMWKRNAYHFPQIRKKRKYYMLYVLIIIKQTMCHCKIWSRLSFVWWYLGKVRSPMFRLCLELSTVTLLRISKGKLFQSLTEDGKNEFWYKIVGSSPALQRL